MDANGMIKIGPGGQKEKGKKWDMPSNQITQILIWYGDHIEAIQFQFVKDGALVLSELHGCNTFSRNFAAVKINHPSEFITELSGQCWNYSAITSLAIVTNLQTHGPIGNHGVARNNEKFRFQIGGEYQFGGFHGSADLPGGLRSMGVYLSLPTSLEQPKDRRTLRSAKKEKP